jgi:hypothetical protein
MLEKGLYLELGAYQCHAFMDWRFVDSDEWSAVNKGLNGAGVESVQAKWEELFLLVKEEKREEEDKMEGHENALKKEKTTSVRKSKKKGNKIKPVAKNPGKVVKKSIVKVQNKVVTKNTAIKPKKKSLIKNQNRTKAVERKPAKRKTVR